MQKPKKFTPSRNEKAFKFNPNIDRDRMYDHDWEKYRVKFLSINSLCYACGSKSTVVDHLTPHKGDESLFKKLDNHIPMCKRCHDTVTAYFDKNYVKNGSIDPKLRWLQKSRIDYGVTVKVKVLPSYK